MGDFSDDDLDGLVEDDFLALEQQSTEATQILSLPLPSYSSQTNAITTNGHAKPISRPATAGGLGYNHQHHSSQSLSRPIPAISSRVDAGRANTHHEPGPSTQREQWRQNRYAATTPGLQRASTVGNISLPHRKAAAPQQPLPNPGVTSSNANGGQESAAELAKLKAEVQAMRMEQEKLKTAAKTANDQMLAKAGEISILRANQARAQQDFEKRLDDLQKKHMLDTDRHLADLNESRKERERLASYNQFMAHEKNDDNWQLRQAQKSAKEKETTVREQITPRKPKPAHFGDGFDDDEVMIISPAKSAGKSRNGTPKGGLKRKRDLFVESPMRQLELGQSIGYLPETEAILEPIIPKDQISAPATHQRGLRFLQHLLNRQTSRDEPRTYEVFSGCFLPSDTKTTLATVLTNEMASVSVSQGSDDFASCIGHVVLSLWSRCLEEQYHKPIRYLIDLIEFTMLEGSGVLANLIDEVVDLTQRTADINVIPRYKRFKRKTASNDPDNRPLDSDINIRQCLELLELTVTLCNRDQELVKRFWKFMRFDFVSMLLRNSQDVGDVTVMVKILSRSVRTDTFAMIVAAPASQSASEQHVIDRLSAMLYETPKVLEGEKRPDAIEICDMRLEILNLIESMTSKTYCGEAFAKHPAALGRLVRVMHDELNALYECRYGQKQRAELINQSTRLLHCISQDYEAAVGNLQEKLRTPPTSVYKYLIALSRLAFSEGSVFEQDLDEDVIDIAHEMLELFTSPDEADAIQKAFRRDGSRSATAQASG